MKILSFDWATKKALTFYDSRTGKVKQIQNTIGAFEKFLATLKEPAIMLFELGGGETLSKLWLFDRAILFYKCRAKR